MFCLLSTCLVLSVWFLQLLLPSEASNLFADAVSTVAEQVRHVPQCDKVDCSAARLWTEPSFHIHGCCGFHEQQQEWLQQDKNTDGTQPHSNIPSASIFNVQLQASTRNLTHSRQLLSVPYPIGAATDIFVPHELLVVAKSMAALYSARLCLAESQRHNCTNNVILLDVTSYLWAVVHVTTESTFCCCKHAHISCFCYNLGDGCEGSNAM
jgi:hypothetical protein